MSDFHQQMAAFDARRGKLTSFDPTQIEGPPIAVPPLPEEGAAPAAPPEVPSAAAAYGAPLEPATEAPTAPPEPSTPSPLIQAGLRAIEAETAHPTPPARDLQVKEVTLWICDGKARLRGEEIQLSEDDCRKIEAILVRSLRNELEVKRRELEKKYQALTGGKPRSPRKKAGSRKKRGGDSSGA